MVLRRDHDLIERDGAEFAATLHRHPCRCAIDQNVPHHHRRESEKVRAIIPLRPRLIDQLEVRLVHQRRRGQCRRAIPRAMPMSDLAKLVVHRDDELVERFAATAPQLTKEISTARLSCHGSRLSRGPAPSCRLPDVLPFSLVEGDNIVRGRD